MPQYLNNLSYPLKGVLKELATTGQGEPNIQHNIKVFQSEMKECHNNLKLILEMKARGMIEKTIDPLKLLERYTANCAIEMSAKQMADAATSIANYGKNPYTNKQIFIPEVVRSVLPTIRKTGFYKRIKCFKQRGWALSIFQVRCGRACCDSCTKCSRYCYYFSKIKFRVKQCAWWRFLEGVI